MTHDKKYASLRESTLAAIGDFLFNEQFHTTQKAKEGILEVINLISDYYEEGIRLFPEIIITNNIEFFKTVSNREIIIKKVALTPKEFGNAIKLCAPLAVGSWVIFIAVEDDVLTYGLVDAELIETSPSIYEQTVGSLAVAVPKMNVAYIRNVGSKTVELIGLKNKLIVSLTLLGTGQTENNNISKISEQITKDCENKFRQRITTFVGKTIQDAIKQGHGNLIGVIKDDATGVKSIKEKFNDGVYLEKPIDMADHVICSENEKTNASSVSLRSFSKIMISMLNHDGITLISNQGKILGYHLFVNSSSTQDIQLSGGARTRAFHAMVESKLFIACFYKSHDGNSEIWIANE